MKKDAKLAKFGVQVEGIDISEELNKQIGSEIMEVVLRNIAKLDLSKDDTKAPSSPGGRLYTQGFFNRFWCGGRIIDLLQNGLQNKKVTEIVNDKLTDDFELGTPIGGQ